MRMTSNGGSLRKISTRLPGFTLIELLVVIGIIGILAGLLIPALAKARERGRAIACLSNLKEVGTGMMLYVDDYQYFPPGREAGITQWDLCIGTYAGGKNDMLSPEARTALFKCPSARIKTSELRLNYSANPNVFKEISANNGPARPDDLHRPTETLVVADAIQYQPDGSSHAILWGVEGSNGKAIYWNDGDPAKGAEPIQVGADKDEEYPTMDAAGSNIRYRHASRETTVLFADGHVARLKKGRVLDRHVYTNY